MKVENLQSRDPTQKGKVEDLVINFKMFLEAQGYKQNTIRTILNRVMSFFSHNRVKLNFARGDLKVHVAESEKVSKEWVLDNIEIRALYSVADIRDKCLMLMLYQSGLSPIDVCSFNKDDLPDLDKTESHYYIDMFREKTDIPQKTCISVECVHDLKLWLKQRGIPKTKALFTSLKGRRLSTRFLE